MKSEKKTTRRFLSGMAGVFFFGTLANTYFIFMPSRYAPHDFNPASAADWFVFAVNALFILYFYLILKNVPNIFARIYWLALLAIFASGFIEKYFIHFSSSASQLFSAVGSAVLCVLSVMFLRLHQKYRFNLFAGITYRLKKTKRPALS